MSMPMLRTGRAYMTILALSAALGACGGDHEDDAINDPTSSVPADASQSVEGFIAYLKRLVASSADALEPVDVSSVTPPTTETGEPTTVD